ncbi:MAG: carbon storage regulator [Dehalococcoidia bacterium]
MLVLVRKVDEAIVIDGGVVIRVLAIDGKRVKLGISAPRSIAVRRQELLGDGREKSCAVAARAGRGRLPRVHGQLSAAGGPDGR